MSQIIDWLISDNFFGADPDGAHRTNRPGTPRRASRRKPAPGCSDGLGEPGTITLDLEFNVEHAGGIADGRGARSKLDILRCSPVSSRGRTVPTRKVGAPRQKKGPGGRSEAAGAAAGPGRTGGACGGGKPGIVISN